MLSGWKRKLAGHRPPRHHRWPRVLAGFCQRGSRIEWDFQSWACSGEYKCCSILQVRSSIFWTQVGSCWCYFMDPKLGVDQLGYQIPEVGVPNYHSNDESFECVATVHQRVGHKDRQDSSRTGPLFFSAVYCTSKCSNKMGLRPYPLSQDRLSELGTTASTQFFGL